MRVLRPNGVSTGCTLRQFETSPQWPQPSHTASLIITRVAGIGARPRLRSRRSSAAHSWSYTSTVTPGTSRSSRWTASSCVRRCTFTPGANGGGSAVAVGIVTDHVDPTDALGLQLPGERGDRQRARRVLATGHRDDAVGQDLERHVGARGDGLPHREEARVGERAVAHVLEAVRLAAEHRRADPLRTLATHLGGAGRAVAREQRHAVAPDATAGDRPFGHDRRPVVRAPGAEVRRARREVGGDHDAGARRRSRSGSTCCSSRRRSAPATTVTSSTPPDGNRRRARRVALARDHRRVRSSRTAATSPAPRGTRASPRRRRSR